VEMQTPSVLPSVAFPSLQPGSLPAELGTVLVITPRQLQDAASVIQAVRQNTNVVVNSSWLEDGPGQRLIDFVCGGLEAIDGQVHRIDEEVFLFTPGPTRVEREDPSGAGS
jgi:cell division inhibitor SepF